MKNILIILNTYRTRHKDWRDRDLRDLRDEDLKPEHGTGNMKLCEQHLCRFQGFLSKKAT